ncbi:MAG TPA: hypothetical protein VK864_15810, partial [Longimicrobiales bacterium]|nr:hypothetical protein [Longimicrobiales bacterium]
SYITESGDTIGTFNAENANGATPPVLKLLRGAVSNHQPGQPTWNYEMHQVYQLDNTNNVDLTSIELRVSLGEISGGRTFKNVNGAPLTLLRLFGLDEDAPVDQVDVAQIYQPGRDPFGAGLGGATARAVSGTYVIFPSLQPFLKPGPVPSAGLSEIDAQAVLGTDANRTIYEDGDPINRESGGRFRLNFRYRLKVEGAVSSFNLGAFGIRENSERLYIGDRQLDPNTDYTIDYDLGTVTLNDAPGLFAANPGAQIRATWEQKSLFQIAPTSVFGLNARYALGRRGELNFVTLYQSEKTIMTRPQLGVEPSSILLGGASGRIDLGGNLLDRALARVPGLRLGLPSSVILSGELAFSVPNPNTRDEAYLDDFEASDEFALPTSRRRWSLGSKPDVSDFANTVLPFPLDATTAARLVWQHDPSQNGQIGGAFTPRNIDQQISIAGNELPESAMWLTFGDTVPNTIGKRWRSITTVLSTTGRDLTRSEFLEFYLWSTPVPGQALVIDLGSISEDAFYYDHNRLTNGNYTDNGEPWGLGVLDEEAKLAQGDIFGPDKDNRGLWDQPCEANLQQQYPLGDPNANCARNNGEPDSEDLNGDGILDTNDGSYFRFVIPIDATSEYLVRDT